MKFTSGKSGSLQLMFCASGVFWANLNFSTGRITLFLEYRKLTPFVLLLGTRRQRKI